MIKSFADRKTERISRGLRSKRFPADLQARARLCLERLDAAEHPSDLRAFPAMRLKRLRGRLRGLFSLRVNEQYRIVFEWKADGAEKVRLLDYH